MLLDKIKWPYMNITNAGKVITPPRKYTAPGKSSNVFENIWVYIGAYIIGIMASANPMREHILAENQIWIKFHMRFNTTLIENFR